jgi:hypothetical protein
VPRAASFRLASFCHCEAIRARPRWPVIAMPDDPSKSLKIKDFLAQKSNNLAAERTGIPKQMERY